MTYTLSARPRAIVDGVEYELTCNVYAKFKYIWYGYDTGETPWSATATEEQAFKIIERFDGRIFTREE